MSILWIIFLAIAAIANATMDTLKDHYSVSIFKNKNKYFWNPTYSWNAKPLFLGIVELDAWHLFKYIMLASLFATAVFYVPILPYHLDLPAMFVWWSAWFELHYSKIYPL
jgi:hypothetical protein